MAKVGIRFSLLYFYIYLFVRVFFHRYWRFKEQQGRGRDHILNHSATSISSRTFIHLFASFHMRYLSRICNSTVCIDQTATRWYLTHYWITIWLIDHAMLIFVCLLDNWILEFCWNNLRQKTGEFQLQSIMTLPLQATRLTKCSSHP